MKKALIIMVALFVSFAFVTGVMAAAKEKPAAAKAMKATGVVAAYEAGKTLTVKAKDKDLAFNIAPDAKIQGDVKAGAKVTVSYKMEGDKMVATAITAVAEKAKPKGK